MSSEIFAKGGSVISLSNDGSSRLVEIEGLFQEGRLSSNTGEGCVGGYIITGITYQDSDITIPVAAIDQSRVLYSAGQNFGQFSVEGIIFLAGRVNPLSDIYSQFSNGRVSNDPNPKTVTGLGIQNLKVFLNKMDIFGGDPATQTLKFSISCIVAPVNNKR